MSSLTVKRKCPHEGACDIDAERADKASGSHSLMADHMTTEQAATLMGVSTRHTRRILAAYRRDGAAALAHGNRGRRPANATSDPLATDVVVLARTRYAGVNHTHLSELLREREGIDIGRNTLRKILTDAGVNSPRRRRPPKHRPADMAVAAVRQLSADTRCYVCRTAISADRRQRHPSTITCSTACSRYQPEGAQPPHVQPPLSTASPATPTRRFGLGAQKNCGLPQKLRSRP